MENTEEKKPETSSAETRRNEELRKALANPDRVEIVIVIGEDATGCRTVVAIKRHGTPGRIAEAVGRCYAKEIKKTAVAVNIMAGMAGMETGSELVEVR